MESIAGDSMFYNTAQSCIVLLCRSLCTVVCKWTYHAKRSSAGHWDRLYFESVGLGELSENNWSAIGDRYFCGNIVFTPKFRDNNDGRYSVDQETKYSSLGSLAATD